MPNSGRKYALSFGGGISVLALGIAIGSWRAAEGGWLLVFADAFTLAGAVMLSVGALLLVSRSGFFDLFLYGMRRLAALVIPPLGVYRVSFYDYKATRIGRPRAYVLPVMLVGAAFFVMAVLLSVLVAV